MERRSVESFPEVSIVIPVYNSADFIAGTLDSVLRQTFKNYEIIVVNDGSTDTEKLERVLEPYMDKIIYIKQKNRGAASARNTAIKNSKSGYIAFLDSDDIWFPEYLEWQMKFIKERNYDLVYCDAMLFGNLKNKKFRTYMQECPSEGEVTTESLLSGRVNLITSGTLAKKNVLVKAGLFDENLTSAFPEDFDLWFRLLKQGAKIGYQKKVLLKYRMRETGLTGSELQKAKRSLKSFEMIASKYELSSEEKRILIEQISRAKNEVTIQRAKIQIVKENFSRAQKLLTKAHLKSPKLKFAVLIALLQISPKFVFRAFRKFRPAEFASIISNLHLY
ncbi:MAG: glycosyltransferase family 2 protein [Pyrinomonadaceae bacterium]|nr:glycosyltransferase family 2 protein [Pyrinomonadaceae bacterium]MCX7640847.1 glycosyltransferase family 2 protein [Pyrinomonadaceae bacterium]MDW8303388.1 glycosyltransferase family A protein [Acidobacteriota bacterium]